MSCRSNSARASESRKIKRNADLYISPCGGTNAGHIEVISNISAGQNFVTKFCPADNFCFDRLRGLVLHKVKLAERLQQARLIITFACVKAVPRGECHILTMRAKPS